MGVIDFFKGIAIGLLVLLLMAAIPAFIMSNSVKSTLLQQSYYETQFEKAGIYLKLHAQMIDGISGMAPADQLATYGITQQEFKDAMAQSITRDWVKNETNRLIRNLLWYLNDETKGVNLSISIKPKIDEGLAILVSEKLGVSQSSALELVSAFTTDIPDPADVEQLAPGTKAALANLKGIVGTFVSVTDLMLYAIIVIMALIFVIKMDMEGFAKTLAWPMLVTGMLLFIGSFIIPNMVVSAINQSGITGSQSLITVTNIIELLSPIFGSVMVQSLVVLVLGILLIAFSFVYPRIAEKKKK